MRVYGDWAQITCSNGWTAWVDGRMLTPVSHGSEPGAVAGGPVAGGPVADGAVAVASSRTGADAVQAPRPRSSAGRTFVVPSAATWPISAGAALVALGAFLPWIDVGGGSRALSALDVPLAFLFGKDRLADGGPGVGLVLLVLAAAAFALGHLAGRERLAKVPGGLCVTVVVTFVVQLNALLSSARGAGGQAVPSLLDALGIGEWPTLAGGGLLVWGATHA
jgi:hypothetical protein